MNKQPHYAIWSGLTVLLVVLAALTILPFPDSRPNLVGYRSLCAFVPMSTLILLGVAAFARMYRDTQYKDASTSHPGHSRSSVECIAGGNPAPIEKGSTSGRS
jgi:hypothetical protein